MTDIKQPVDTNSAEFKHGVESGRELNDELENKEPVSGSLFREPSTPLFLSDSSEGKKGNAQDEKDETEE